MFGGWGETCFGHRRLLLVGWVLVVIAGAGAAPTLVSQFTNPRGDRTTESVRGFRLLDSVDPVGDTVLVLSSAHRTLDLAGLARAEDRLRRVPGVLSVQGPADGGRLLSRDRRSALSVISLSKDLDDSQVIDLLPTIRRAVSQPGTDLRLGGNAIYDEDLNHGTETDTARAEVTSLPVALVLMFFVFGGLVAASLPLLAAMASLSGCVLLLLAAGTVVDITPYTFSVASMLGLGLSVDYSLLLVHRFREELLLGHEHHEAVGRAVATAGRTIAFSALTVVASLCALAVFADPVFRSLAVGGIGVVLVAGLAGTTLTPALLAVLGPRIRPGKVRHEDTGVFSRIAGTVQRRPWPIALACGGLLIVAFLPFLGVRFHTFDPRELPPSSQARQVALAITADFPGGSRPDEVTVVSRVPRDDPAVSSWISWARTQRPVSEVTLRTDLPATVTAISVRPFGESEGADAVDLVHLLREHRLAPDALVTGDAAYLVDSERAVSRGLPWALALITLATCVLLFLMTGSLVIPVKALLISLVSLGATFGALTWIFQDGHLSSLLGFTPSGALDTFVPVLVFTFAFGLSMDYEVFLLARIKEAVDAGHPDDEAVRLGLQRSGRIVTAAALLIIVVFIGFAAGRTVPTKEIGVGLALAVLIDATLVRCLLVPATMTLLGRRNWWAPAPMQRWAARSGFLH